MSPLPVEVVVKATVLLVMAGVLQVAMRPRASAAARHLIWSLAIGSVLILPFASTALPRWNVDIPVTQETPVTATVGGRADAIDTSTPASFPAPSADQAAVMPATPVIARAAMTWPILLVAIYAGGVLLLLIRLAVERF